MRNWRRLARWTYGLVALGDKHCRVCAGRLPHRHAGPGHVPLVALTRRRLCGHDISAIASDLIARRVWPISPIDIGVEITRITNQLPTPEDVERVQRRVHVMRCSRG